MKKSNVFFVRCTLAALATLALALPAAAQQATGSALGDQENLRLLSGGDVNAAIITVDKRYEGVRGTPFLLPVWASGNLLLASQKQVAGVPLKYDVYNQQLMAKRPAGDSLWVELRNIREFTLTDPRALPGQANQRRFRRFSGAPGLPPRTDFLEVLHDSGPYQLLKRPGKQLVKANYQQAYSADKPYDELVDNTDYYLLSPQGTLSPVKPAAKALLSAVPGEFQEPLRAKLKKAPLRTESDLFNAVSELNLLASAKK
ncbi:hypothetical protein HER32_18185 [Hymenobacter sp. BT18]|uniref:hypothetical protein n=1 Tax=Hymenobacter sp. BT18 TaxID=2835648 RepID=UPI00143EF0F8|nr:hypothetical protein [Hymenobacter sp. BT18]QIX62996.1 hypothetical protein HER32_18185 [Hymenobacter sp. BT18]